MASFIIEGGHRISGEIKPQGAKNEALQIICATILTREEVRVANIPDILDVNNLIRLLEDMNVKTVRHQKGDITFCAKDIDINYLKSQEFLERCSRLRGSVLLLGPLVARFGHAVISRPGGDKIGRRRLVQGWTVSETLPQNDVAALAINWFGAQMRSSAAVIADHFSKYRLSDALMEVYHLFWDEFSAWFLELVKPAYGQAIDAATYQATLSFFNDLLHLLHPFMPFITEELYQALPGSAETIMTQSWPTFDEAHNWAEEEEAFEKVMDYIKAVRTMRTEMNVHPAKKTSMIIETADPAPFRNAEVYLAKFAFATDVTFTEKYEGSTDGMVQVSTHAARGFIPMMELIDREKELARLNKEKAKAEKEMAMFGNQLNNPKFVERAPAALVEEIRTKFAKSQDKLANIEQSIKALG